MKSLNEQIGERLKNIRVSKGISQSQLAEFCGWSGASRVANYEKGTRSIGADDAIALTRVLNVSPSFLLFGDKENTGASLPEKQQALLSLFRQLPDSEQDNIIGFVQLRLKELDEYVEKYIKGRFKKAEK